MKLTLANVSYCYSHQESERVCEAVLKNISLDLESGSYWCIGGPNGSGKSTLLKLIAGLLPSDGLQGQVFWDAKPLAEYSRIELARMIGFVPGSLRPRFAISVFDFILQGRFAHSPLWRRSTQHDREKANTALSRLGILYLSASLITEISVGELQLVLIARALAQNPRVLILDEVTANLDLSFQGRVYKLFKELNAEGVSIFLVSHDINLATEFCPNALWLRAGTIYSMGEMSKTLSHQLLKDLYAADDMLEVGTNPFTNKPKIFWRQIT